MKVSVFASTHPGYILPIEDAKLMSGQMAGICYMKEDFDAIASEPAENTMRRANGTIKSGHHSTFGHASYGFLFEGVPKILAMLLNNEKDFETSEKSARYTFMLNDNLDTIDSNEKRLYDKWFAIFTDLIKHRYPEIKVSTVEKLAKENARYFISVFTPVTVMAHSLSIRQANYLIGFAEDFAKNAGSDPFKARLAPYLTEFVGLLKPFLNIEGMRDNKGRHFSLFASRTRSEQFGETYSVNYSGSFAQLAQAQRHRSLWYEMQIPSLYDVSFYVPPIIESPELRKEYLSDMESVKESYPQGMMVRINERGTVEAFTWKCQERLCGAAQLEICLRTQRTLEKYISATIHNLDMGTYETLAPFSAHRTKCQFGYYTCDRPCPLGPKHAFDRLI